MNTITFSHRRTSGLMHTYDIECSDVHFNISLNGKTLKEARFGAQAGNAWGLEELQIHAISAIEQLTGMEEE